MDESKNWHPVGFYQDPSARRGWGTLREAVTDRQITFNELVARYNWLLTNQKVPEKDVTQVTR